MDAVATQRLTISKVTRRIIPFLVLVYCINFLDRVNIGFAALQMNKDLGFTPEVYGFAAGILFIGYTLFAVPSNMALEQFGARRWLATIMIVWGLLAAANAFVADRYSLYALRFILGCAESGFFPGLVIYTMRWFPAQYRAFTVTLFMIGTPISVIFGAPISTLILSLHGFLGLAGWKWLFILEGIPSVLLGVAALFILTDDPRTATWLEPSEREWLSTTIEDENKAKRPLIRKTALRDVMMDSRVQMLSVSKFCVLLSFFGITLWIPQIIAGLGRLSTFQVGLVTTIPYIVCTVSSILVSRSSDRTGERTYHIVIPAIVGTIGFLIAAFTHNPYVGLLGLSVAAAGVWVSNTIFWTLPAAILSGATAAVGVAYINAIGNIGEFVGPYFTGWIRGATHSYSLALAMLGGSLAVNALLVMGIGVRTRQTKLKAAIVAE